VNNLSCYDDDEMYPDEEPDEEPDEYEEAMGNCHGWFENNGKGAFMCGAVGSEDCDECPFYRDLGMTAAEVEDRDNEEIFEQLRHEEWLKLKDFAP
jgi:hypothetical protein